MKLRALRVRDVKGVGPTGMAIEHVGDGLNVLAAENEFGKSTLFEALRVVLFEKHNGKNANTRALRPYAATGGPTVEVDLETKEGLFRVHKRFLSRPAATVLDLATGQAVASGDEVQDWLVDLLDADKADDGPTGLLWVGQGSSLSQPVATNSSSALLSGLIEQTVSEVTGGARVRAVLAMANAQLMKLVTKDKRMPTGRYREALKKRDDYLADIADIDARIEEAEATRAVLTKNQNELAALEDPNKLAARKVTLKDVTEKWMQAEQLRTRLDSVEREILLVEQALKRDGQTLQDLEKARAQAASDHKALDAVVKKIAVQEEHHTKQKEIYVAAVKREDEHKAALLTVKTEWEQARNVENARVARDRLQTATVNLAAAEAIQAALSKALTVRDAVQVDRAGLEHLEDQHRAVERAEARRAAGQATVSVSYAPDARNKVRIDGRYVAHNATHSVEGRLELEVETVGRITIEAGAGEEQTSAQQQSKNTQDSLKQALSALGVASLADARDALEKRTQAEAEINARRAELLRVAPDGVQSLKDARTKLAALVDEQAEEGVVAASVDDMDKKLRDAEAGLETRQRDRQNADSQIRDTEHLLRELRADRARLMQQIETVRQRFGADDTWAGQHDELSRALATTKQHLSDKSSEIRTLQEQAADVEHLAAEKERLETAEAERAKQMVHLNREIGVREGELRKSDSEGLGEKRADVRGLLTRIEGEIAALEGEKRALELLTATLEHVEADQQNQFFAPLMAELRPLLHEVMPESELKLASDFAPDTIVRDGLAESVIHLSGGTREQIAILTRLAFARLMARRGRRMPVVLDDALVYADDDRIARMFQALTLAAKDIQLIVLTCRQKTFQDLGGTKLQVQNWAVQT